MAAELKVLMTTMLPLSSSSTHPIQFNTTTGSIPSWPADWNTSSFDNMSTIIGGLEVVDDVEYQSSETRFPAYMSLLMTLSCGLILLVGLIGNCLVPVVIWNNRDLRNSTNLFLLNLSLADILVLCISMPTVLVEIQRPEVWKLGQVMCKLVPFVELSVAHASVLTILAISFERYYVITRPLRAGYTCTRMRALFIILAIWIFGCLTTSPILFIAEYKEDDEDSSPFCVTEADTFWPFFFFMASICLFFFFPLIVLVLIYTVIARHLVADPCTTSNHRIQVQTSASVAAGSDGINPNLRARRQVVTMLGTVVAFFFICLLPFRIFTLWVILTPVEKMKTMSVETYYHALNFCRVMFYLNSAINPILYNVMSSKFRTAFLKALGLTWAGRRKRLLRHLSRQSTFNTTTTSGAATSTHSTSNHHSEQAGNQRELIKRLTKEALVDKETNTNTNTNTSPRPMLQKYGRQGSCTSAANRASSKPLLTVTLSTSTSTTVTGPATGPGPVESSHNDSHV